MELTRELGMRVLAAVDPGLTCGIGRAEPGHMCVEAAVCYAMGMPHSDNPDCVSPSLRAFKIRLNDSHWSSNLARAKGLRRLAIAQLGSAGVLDDKVFVAKLVEMTIRKIVPLALRSVPPLKGHTELLEAAAKRCEEEGSLVTVLAARNAAAAAANAATYAAAAANAATYAAANAYAAAYAANAYAAAYAATDAAANAATYAAAANAATYAAKANANSTYAANAAANAYAAAANDADNVLRMSADICVDILREMKAPGIALMDELIPS